MDQLLPDSCLNLMVDTEALAAWQPSGNFLEDLIPWPAAPIKWQVKGVSYPSSAVTRLGIGSQSPGHQQQFVAADSKAGQQQQQQQSCQVSTAPQQHQHPTMNEGPQHLNLSPDSNQPLQQPHANINLIRKRPGHSITRISAESGQDWHYVKRRTSCSHQVPLLDAERQVSPQSLNQQWSKYCTAADLLPAAEGSKYCTAAELPDAEAVEVPDGQESIEHRQQCTAAGHNSHDVHKAHAMTAIAAAQASILTADSKVRNAVCSGPPGCVKPGLVPYVDFIPSTYADEAAALTDSAMFCDVVQETELPEDSSSLPCNNSSWQVVPGNQVHAEMLLRTAAGAAARPSGSNALHQHDRASKPAAALRQPTTVGLGKVAQLTPFIDYIPATVLSQDLVEHHQGGVTSGHASMPVAVVIHTSAAFDDCEGCTSSGTAGICLDSSSSTSSSISDDCLLSNQDTLSSASQQISDSQEEQQQQQQQLGSLQQRYSQLDQFNDAETQPQPHALLAAKVKQEQQQQQQHCAGVQQRLPFEESQDVDATQPQPGAAEWRKQQQQQQQQHCNHSFCGVEATEPQPHALLAWKQHQPALADVTNILLQPEQQQQHVTSLSVTAVLTAKHLQGSSGTAAASAVQQTVKSRGKLQQAVQKTTGGMFGVSSRTASSSEARHNIVQNTSKQQHTTATAAQRAIPDGEETVRCTMQGRPAAAAAAACSDSLQLPTGPHSNVQTINKAFGHVHPTAAAAAASGKSAVACDAVNMLSCDHDIQETLRSGADTAEVKQQRQQQSDFAQMVSNQHDCRSPPLEQHTLHVEPAAAAISSDTLGQRAAVSVVGSSRLSSGQASSSAVSGADGCGSSSGWRVKQSGATRQRKWNASHKPGSVLSCWSKAGLVSSR